MALLKALSERYPLAVASFVKWVTARNMLSPYTPYLRRPLTELPIELLYGVMVPFFEDSGLLISFRYTNTGRQRTIIHSKRLMGGYKQVHKGVLKSNMIEGMKYAVSASMRTINTKLNNSMSTPIEQGQTDVLVGLDIDALLSDARKEQIQCLL